jgi:hypothetical protein
MVQHAGTDAAQVDRVCVLKGGEAVFSQTDVEAAAVCSAALFSGITSRDKLVDQTGGSATGQVGAAGQFGDAQGPFWCLGQVRENRAGTEGHTRATLQILVKDPRGRDEEIGKGA